MKKGIFSAFALASLFLVACGEGETEVVETPVVEAVTYTADAANTKVNWKGEVAGVYGHEGFVNLKSGTVVVEGDKLVGGEFVIDMTGIFPTDSASYKDEDGRRASDLVGHLATEDFFASATYPTSTFVVTAVNGNTVTGNLTVRNKTNVETLELSQFNVTETGVTMVGKLVFDRQKYDVAWVHFMKDMVLSDDIQIGFNLVAAK